jgi:hypothetical protein
VVKKAKIKKKAKKRTISPKEVVPEVKPISPWEYFIDEAPISMKTEDVQNRLDELGRDGWQLLFIGPYGGPPDTVRIYLMRPK